MSTLGKPLLELRNLSIDFGAEPKVNALSYKLEKGKILGIVGESGSGKSLSSLAIMNLLPSQANVSGEILFSPQPDGKTLSLLDMTTQEMEDIRGNEIAMIFQEPMTSLNPLMRCGHQVMEVFRLHQPENAKEENVIALFEKVQLPSPKESFQKYPHQLSGGQKQRVMIAMALACKPSILIADEPSTALDVTVQKDIIALLQDLVDADTAMIFISHDLGLVSDICDDILVMYQGSTMEYGSTESVVTHPNNEYTKALLSCRPSKNYKLEYLPTMSDFVDNTEDIDYSPKQDISQGKEILNITNLNVHFPIENSKNTFYHALDDINLSLNEMECLGIVGESGSGKSTIANAMMGMVTPSSGTMTYRNQAVNYDDKTSAKFLRKQIQMVFQDPYSSLNGKIKIGSAIDEVLKVNIPQLSKSERKSRCIDLLQEVGLIASDYDKYPHEFSGGQRQRVVIARALAVEPEILICDESVSALDVSVQAQVLNLLRDLQKNKDLSLIFISHDLSVVRFLCQKIAVLQKGKLVEIQETEQLFQNPETAYTQQLIDDIPGKRYELSSIN